MLTRLSVPPRPLLFLEISSVRLVSIRCQEGEYDSKRKFVGH